MLSAYLSGCATPTAVKSPTTDPVADISAPTVSAVIPAPAESVELVEPSVTQTEPVLPALTPPVIADTDTWVRLANDFSWPEYDHPAVDAWLIRLGAKKSNFELATRQAEPYLWFITEAITKRHLPAELALVPFIESGFRARARSPRGAVGLWQFMPSTAKRFHLKQTVWYDERRDVVAATGAALDYLEQLARRFKGDWLLALAAYNCGPAKVARAIKKNRVYDFWKISHDLPRETRNYVPQLLATAKIITNPYRYGIELHPIANSQLFASIDLGRPVDLRPLSKLDGWSKRDFDRLNPAFNRHHTDPNGPFRIIAPVQLEQKILGAIANLSDENRTATRVHVVQSGDTISEIAERYGVAIDTLRLQNNISRNLIRVGAKLVLAAAQEARPIAADYPLTTPEVYDHIVRRGESLWIIARKYGSSTKRIAQANGISLRATLQPGERLLIPRRPLKTSSSVISDTRSAVYRVSNGDSLWTIARKFNVTVRDLQVWNNLLGDKILRPGQSLIVSKPRTITAQKI